MNKFSKTKKEFETGKALIKNENYEYPITYQLIKDGRKNKILNKRINSKIKVTVIHGQKDEVVPIKFSRLLLKLVVQEKCNNKNGDHSLSDQNPLEEYFELDAIIKNVI